MNASDRLVRTASLAGLLAIAASLAPGLANAGSGTRDCYRELRRHGEFRTFTTAIRRCGWVGKVRRIRSGACLAPVNSAFLVNPIHRTLDRHLLRRRIGRCFVSRAEARHLLAGPLDLVGRRILAGRNFIFPVGRLIPPLRLEDRNLLEIIDGDPRFTIFSDLVRESGLSGLLVQGVSPYTIFVPTDHAFLGVWEELAALTPGERGALVRDHLVRGRLPTRSLRTGDALIAVSFEPLDVMVRGDFILIENARIDRRYADVNAVNGILHQVDEVVVPW